MQRIKRQQSVLLMIMNKRGKIAKRWRFQDWKIRNTRSWTESFWCNLWQFQLETKKSILKHKLKQNRQKKIKTSMKKSRKKPYYKDIEVPSQFFVIMLARKKLLFKTLYLRKVLKVASNGCSNLVIMISSFAGLISMTMMISASIQKALESKHVQNSLTLLLIHPREIQPPSSTSCWSIPITTFHKSVLSNQLKT